MKENIFKTMALATALLIASAGWAATNTNNPAAPTGIGSTNPPLSVTPPNTLPMATPSQVDPMVPGTNTTNEVNNRSQRALRSAEVCEDSDAACLRRREEQIRRNTPFNQRVPPSPGTTVTPTPTEVMKQ